MANSFICKPASMALPGTIWVSVYHVPDKVMFTFSRTESGPNVCWKNSGFEEMHWIQRSKVKKGESFQYMHFLVNFSRLQVFSYCIVLISCIMSYCLNKKNWKNTELVQIHEMRRAKLFLNFLYDILHGEFAPNWLNRFRILVFN